MTSPEWWETLFGTFSFMAALLAAHLWFRASKIKLPPHTSDSYDGKGPFADALARPGAMNANAAFAAAIAALLQALSIGSKVIGPLIGLS
jgi:hypothetical protein